MTTGESQFKRGHKALSIGSDTGRWFPNVNANGDVFETERNALPHDYKNDWQPVHDFTEFLDEKCIDGEVMSWGKSQQRVIHEQTGFDFMLYVGKKFWEEIIIPFVERLDSSIWNVEHQSPSRLFVPGDTPGTYKRPTKRAVSFRHKTRHTLDSVEWERAVSIDGFLKVLNWTKPFSHTDYAFSERTGQGFFNHKSTRFK